jgi:hypothetical protein
VSFAVLTFWQYGEMPQRDQRFAALPSQQVFVAQRDLADAKRADSVSKALADSSWATVERLMASNKNGDVPQFFLNTYQTNISIHSNDSSLLALSELSLREAEDRHRDEIERSATWTQVIQDGLLALLVVFVVCAIVATFVWFGRRAQEPKAQSDA